MLHVAYEPTQTSLEICCLLPGFDYGAGSLSSISRKEDRSCPDQIGITVRITPEYALSKPPASEPVNVTAFL